MIHFKNHNNFLLVGRFFFSGRSFAVCSTEGVSVFSLDHRNLFNPFELGIEVTPVSVENALKEGEYSAALKMALQLNQSEMMENVLLCTPVAQSRLIFSEIVLKSRNLSKIIYDSI